MRAGLNPTDWMEMVRDGMTLHKIVLDKEQASLCVVAEGLSRPTEKEIEEFREKERIPLVGSQRRYVCENYEKSFVPLLEYIGGYNLPEVLIPISVETEIVTCARLYLLVWKLKTWFARKKPIAAKVQKSNKQDTRNSTLSVQENGKTD